MPLHRGSIGFDIPYLNRFIGILTPPHINKVNTYYEKKIPTKATT